MDAQELTCPGRHPVCEPLEPRFLLSGCEIAALPPDADCDTLPPAEFEQHAPMDLQLQADPPNVAAIRVWDGEPRDSTQPHNSSLAAVDNGALGTVDTLALGPLSALQAPDGQSATSATGALWRAVPAESNQAEGPLSLDSILTRELLGELKPKLVLKI